MKERVKSIVSRVLVVGALLVAVIGAAVGAVVIVFAILLWAPVPAGILKADSMTMWLAAVSFTTLLFLAAGFVGALKQLMATQKTTHAELLSRLNETWYSELFLKARQCISKESKQGDFCRKLKELDDGDELDYFVMTNVLDFLDDMAYLVNTGFLPLKDVRNSFAPSMVYYYEDVFSGYIREVQAEPGNKSAYKQLETVVKLVRKDKHWLKEVGLN